MALRDANVSALKINKYGLNELRHDFLPRIAQLHTPPHVYVAQGDHRVPAGDLTSTEGRCRPRLLQKLSAS